MKNQVVKTKYKPFMVSVLVAIMALLLSQFSAFSQQRTPLRRPTSTTSPMWIIHIDTWNAADPEKIIKLVPEDIKPYVVFNVSLSVSDFVIKKYPFTICESWIRACAENRVWVMIQPASGYLCNMPYSFSDEYEYFYKTYPNFLGWNFAEQNWGFPSGNEFKKRLDLFVELLKLGDKYGGYLSVSNFMGVGNYTNVMGQLKEHAAFEQACKTYNRNYILQDKFTFPSGFYDNESAHLGAFLSGYAGHYGIRFDECGWRAQSDPFAESSGIAAVMEHFLLTGATVTDGPETIPMQATHQISNYTTSSGFTSKRWEMYPQMVDVHVDMFRKIIDGTFRIPGRQEVIERTKVAYVNDLKQGTNLQKYSSDASLYTGLYAMDGELDQNNTWFKKTGRYPSIPMIHKSGNDETGAFQTVVTKQDFPLKWGNTQTKVNEFNKLFPAECTGDGFAARIKNTWLTYNPYMNVDKKSISAIPFKYNTCDSISLKYSRFNAGIINEYADKLHIYLNNYCTNAVYGIREEVISVYGCTNKPTYKFKDRGRVTSTVTDAWENGTFTITIKHNGPLDIDINCAGNATGRSNDYPATFTMVEPAKPPVYFGPRQYEGENFDYQNITSVSQTDLQNYTAMGYLNFGSNTAARIMDSISVSESGEYILNIKYRATSSDIRSIDLYINNKKVATPVFKKTVNDSRVWNTHTQKIVLNKGTNVIQFKANNYTSSFQIDNIIIAKQAYDFNYDQVSDIAGDPYNVTIKAGTLGVINNDNTVSGSGNCLKTYSAGTTNNTGVANLDLFPASLDDYTVIWKEYNSAPGSANGILMRGNGASTYAQGLNQGYVLVSQKDAGNKVTLKTYKAGENAIELIRSFSPDITLTSGKPCWYRASAIGDKLMLECSLDSINWTGANETSFTDDTFASGNTQLVWGLGAVNSDWIIDNISYKSANVVLTPAILTELSYVRDGGPSASKSFIISASSLSGNLHIVAPEKFEISLNSTSGFTSEINLTSDKEIVASTLIYARMKSGLASGQHLDTLKISSALMKDYKVVLSGVVENKPLTKTYNFETDVAKTAASTPPAKNITVGSGNTATAGVVSYKDNNGLLSNMLKPYSGGQRESTGILNLNLFSKQATNYSVTWKQILGSGTDSYKIGAVLRGDSAKIGDGKSGYVNGMMQGYVFIAYTNRGSNNTEFRIYKSTSGNGLETYANNSVGSLRPTAGQVVWFRASVTGNTIVYLNFEYSLNGTTWTSVSKYTDNDASYLSGATQLIWGLGTGSTNFYYDDIIYNGVALNEDETTVSNKKITVSSYATVVSEQYFNIIGQPVTPAKMIQQKGIYIIRSTMSDGTVKTRKVYTE